MGIGLDFKRPGTMITSLFILFVILAILFNSGVLRPLGMWWTLAICAIGFFAIEYHMNKTDKKRIKLAVLVGVFLVAFDFLFENSGTILGLWRSSGSIFPVLTVPTEVMIICLFGGTAWALYLPRKFNLLHTMLDILLFATFGAYGEYVLMQNGMMMYYQWWTSIHAFAAYAGTWIILHAVKYKLMSK